MFKIYIPEQMLQQIELDELDAREHSSWYKILHASPLGLYKMNNSPEDYNSEGLDNNYGSNEIMNGTNLVDDKSDYIFTIVNDISKITENPCGYYILDIAPKEAERVRNEYGVLCFSINEKMSTKFLDRIAIYKTSEKGRKMSWKENFPLGELIPSNLLVISDRNLFSRVYGEEINTIYDNIRLLISTMIWKSLSNNYNILIVFDESSIKPKDKDLFSFVNITQNLDIIRRNLPMNSDRITIELLSVSAPPKREEKVLSKEQLNDMSEAHKRTHDRRILSNYFQGFTTFRLIAFNDDKCLHGQKITFETLFCNGMDLYSDCPLKEHDRMYNDMLNIYKTVKKYPEYYSYSINGRIKSPTSFVNRLLTATEL